MFVPYESRIGQMPIAGIDTGVTTPGGVVVPSGPAKLGSTVRASDPVYGEGEFILLTGVAGNQVGSCVIWDGNWNATLCPATANQSRPVAFSMSANVNPAAFSWYQINGQVQALKDTSAAVNAGVAIGIVSTGAVGNTGAGLEIEGARSTNTATVAAATTLLPIQVNRPNMQGRIT